MRDYRTTEVNIIASRRWEDDSAMTLSTLSCSREHATSAARQEVAASNYSTRIFLRLLAEASGVSVAWVLAGLGDWAGVAVLFRSAEVRNLEQCNTSIKSSFSWGKKGVEPFLTFFSFLTFAGCFGASGQWLTIVIRFNTKALF